jgi:hypothetical protein
MTAADVRRPVLTFTLLAVMRAVLVVASAGDHAHTQPSATWALTTLP